MWGLSCRSLRIYKVLDRLYPGARGPRSGRKGNEVRTTRWLGIEPLGRLAGLLALPALAVGLYLGLVWAPPDAMMGNVQRVMYVHFPSWIATALAYVTAFVCSVLYLARRRESLDHLAQAGVEVGVLFNTTGLITGSIWGRPTWGVWWTWDPRLTTTAILLLIYVGYLAVRRLPDNPSRRARWAAVVGIVGFADIPVVHLSVTWWRSLHQGPTVRLLGESTIAPIMLAALLVSLAAFTLVYLALMAARLRVGRLEDRVAAEALSPKVGRPPEELVDEGVAVG